MYKRPITNCSHNESSVKSLVGEVVLYSHVIEMKARSILRSQCNLSLRSVIKQCKLVELSLFTHPFDQLRQGLFTFPQTTANIWRLLFSGVPTMQELITTQCTNYEKYFLSWDWKKLTLAKTIFLFMFIQMSIFVVVEDFDIQCREQKLRFTTHKTTGWYGLLHPSKSAVKKSQNSQELDVIKLQLVQKKKIKYQNYNYKEIHIWWRVFDV